MKKIFVLCCLVVFCISATLGCSKPSCSHGDHSGEAPASTTAAK